MAQFFNKSLTAEKVKRSQYTGPLESLAAALEAKGGEYSKYIKSFLPELLARPDRAYTAADRDKFGPIQEEFLKTARNPIDDALTQFYDTQARRATEGRLASRGLIGQGIGEGVQNQLEESLKMGNRATADARRLGATSAADTIETNLQGRDYAGRNAVLSGIKDIGATDLGYTQAPADIYSRLLGYDAQRRSQDANLLAAAKSPFDIAVDTALQFYSAGQGKMKNPSGGDVGGGPSDMGEYGKSWDYGRSGGGGEFRPASKGFDLYGDQMEQPGMAKYSLYGDEEGGSGSALRRSGALRFLGG